MKPRILCTGIAVLDYIFRVDSFPPRPMKVFATDHVTIGGGPAANGAVTVVRLGGAAALWARVGDDGIGRMLVEELAACGVDTTHIRLVPGHRSGAGAIILDRNGERFSAGFIDRSLDPDASWLPLSEVAGFDAVLCDVRWPAGSEAVLREARRQGVRTVLDADLTDDDAVPRLAGLADYVVFSELALERLTGSGDVEAGLFTAQSRIGGAVAVTLGGNGYAWLADGRCHHRPAFRVDVVDTLAAGDVFHGAFALAIARNASIEEAGRFAAGAAALKCTRWGGRAGIPDAAELARFLDGQESSLKDAR